MTRPRLILLVILSAAISAGLTAWLTRQCYPQAGASPGEQAKPAQPGQRDFHQWLHAQLELTTEQKAELASAEAHFEKERARLQKELATISGDLAHALGEPEMGPEDLRPLITRRHRLQGELQELIMAHLLEKRALLTPGQREQYRQWIHQGIDHDHGD